MIRHALKPTHKNALPLHLSIHILIFFYVVNITALHVVNWRNLIWKLSFHTKQENSVVWSFCSIVWHISILDGSGLSVYGVVNFRRHFRSLSNCHMVSGLETGTGNWDTMVVNETYNWLFVNYKTVYCWMVKISWSHSPQKLLFDCSYLCYCYVSYILWHT